MMIDDDFMLIVILVSGWIIGVISAHRQEHYSRQFNRLSLRDKWNIALSDPLYILSVMLIIIGLVRLMRRLV